MKRPATFSDKLDLVTISPIRGYHYFTFPAPANTPLTLTGTRGEVATRLRTFGNEQALYLGVSLSPPIPAKMLSRNRCLAVMSMRAPRPGTVVKFAAHPNVIDNLFEIVGEWRVGGEKCEMQAPRLINETGLAQEYSLTYRSGNVLIDVYTMIVANSSVVDIEFGVRTVDRKALETPITVSFGEPISGVFNLPGLVQNNAKSVTFNVRLGIASMHLGRFRLACTSWLNAMRQAGVNHALLDHTAEELQYHASMTTCRAVPIDWDGDWLGLGVVRSDSSVHRDTITMMIDAMERGQILANWQPRINPNPGGTDPSFATNWTLPIWMKFPTGNGYSIPDPRVVDLMQASALNWLYRPMYYHEPTTQQPLSPPPAHATPELTFHNQQPYEGSIDGSPVPKGVGLDGLESFDEEHRSRKIMESLFALTGSRVLGLGLELMVAGELHNRAVKTGWGARGRADGRISQNTGAMMLFAPTRKNDIHEYLRRRYEIAAGHRKPLNRGIAPHSTDARGVKWAENICTNAQVSIPDSRTIVLNPTNVQQAPRVGFAIKVTNSNNPNGKVCNITAVDIDTRTGLIFVTVDGGLTPNNDAVTTIESLEEAWSVWEEAQAGAGGYFAFRLTDDPYFAQEGLVYCRNAGWTIQRLPDGTFCSSYLVRWLRQDGFPDMGPDGLDTQSVEYGPNGIFAWTMVGVRTGIIMAQDIGVEFLPPDQLRVCAAALKWMDDNIYPHQVDEHIALARTSRDAYEHILTA